MIIYNLPENDYHNQSGGTKYFGIHSLMDYLNECPAYFYKRHITGEIKDTRKHGVYDLGSAAHALVLEGDEAYSKCTAIKPSSFTKKEKMTKKRAKELSFTEEVHNDNGITWIMSDDGFYYADIEKSWSGNASECKDWMSENADKYILHTTENDSVHGMRDEVKRFEPSRDILKNSLSEVTIRREIKTVNGLLPVQIRIDSVTLDGDGEDVMNWVGLCDYKTTESLSKFKGDVVYLHYAVQAAFYRQVTYEETGLSLPWDFLAQEKHKPYKIGRYETTEETLQIGEDVLRHLLPAVAESLKNDSWPVGHEHEEI